MDIEFSFFATVDRIDCTNKKVHLSPAYTYEENTKNEPPQKSSSICWISTPCRPRV